MSGSGEFSRRVYSARSDMGGDRFEIEVLIGSKVKAGVEGRGVRDCVRAARADKNGKRSRSGRDDGGGASGGGGGTKGLVSICRLSLRGCDSDHGEKERVRSVERAEAVRCC